MTNDRKQTERRLVERSTPDRRETLCRLIDLGHQIEDTRPSRERLIAWQRAECAKRGVLVG